MRIARATLLTLCLGAGGMLAACGSDSAEETTEERPTETAERVGKLPAGWEVLTNDVQGYAIGVPPGWGEGKACGKAAPPAATGTTLLCSPDRLVTLNVSVDRTNEALEVAPTDAAGRTAEAISEQNFGGRLKSGEPKPVKGHYDGAAVTGDGSSGGVEEEIEVYALQREGIAAITAVIAANADEDANAGVKLAEEAVESLRTKPVG
jgi:hypothetical protein